MAISMQRDLDGRRIAALGISLSIHLAMLMLLLGDRPEPVAVASTEPILVRLIPDVRRTPPGPPAEDRAPDASAATIPAAMKKRPKATRADAIVKRLEKPRPQATQTVLTLEPLPPPQRDDRPVGRPSSLLSGSAPTLASSGAATSTDGDRGLGGGGTGDTDSIQYIKKVRPRLPRSTIARDWSGYTLLGLRIDVNGKPIEVVVLRSSSLAEADEAARRAARRSTYLPHLENGRPVEHWAVVPVVFGGAIPHIELDLAELAAQGRSGRSRK